MKQLEIFDEELELPIGVLLCFEEDNTVVIELQDGLDEWTAPLLFTDYVKKGICTIPRDISRLWLQERVIPAGRQNISSILALHKIKEYDELKLLINAEGRCAQDRMCIRELGSLPAYVTRRMQHNLRDCIMLSGSAMLCLFADGSVRRTDLKDCLSVPKADKVAANPELFRSGRITPGGYSVTFGGSIDIPASLLYSVGTPLPLTAEDLLAILTDNVLDTSECCSLLGCSRQNLSYLVSRGDLTPLKTGVRGNLYLKGDVLKTGW